VFGQRLGACLAERPGEAGPAEMAGREVFARALAERQRVVERLVQFLPELLAQQRQVARRPARWAVTDAALQAHPVGSLSQPRQVALVALR